MCMYHPDLLPEYADEEGSVRYECMIAHIKVFAKEDSCKYYNLIDISGVFVIVEKSHDYKLFGLELRSGIVVCNHEQIWSWWFHIIS